MKLGDTYPALKRYDVADLHDLFCEAATTMRYLPPALRKQQLNFWPAFNASDYLNYADENTAVHITPSTGQVSRYELSVNITFELSLEDRKLIWSVALSQVNRRRGVAWKRLSKLFHCNVQTLKNDYEKAIVQLFLRI